MRSQIAAAPALAGVAVAICLAFGLVQLTWTLAGEPLRGSQAVRSFKMPDASSSTPIDIESIVALAPFGILTSGLSATSAQQSDIKLTLQGILMAANPAWSQAIVVAAGGKAESYFAGDTLPGGAVLVRVEAAQIILRVGGSEESLTFPPPARPGASVAALIPGGANQTANTPAPIDEVIVRARQRIAQNPQTLLNELGVEAGTDGYTIGPAASAITRRAGFRPGDVVIQVNGVAVGNVESDRKLFEDVVAAGRARVEIMRDGKITILTFPLK